MAITTYKIRVKVTLYTREDEIDLTPWVKTLSVNKTLADPSGSFEISMLPATDRKPVLSWYYRVSPMDYIEIGFTRNYEDIEIPIVMRGFVDNVSRSAMVDNNGSPNRGYTISGRDFGKILEISRIYYLKELSSDLRLMALPGHEKFKEKYGVQLTGKPTGIIKDILSVAQDQLTEIQELIPRVPSIDYLASTTILGSVNQFCLTQDDGSVWDLLRYFDNAPWNELFIMDLSTGPTLVFRETPWKDYSVDNDYIVEPDSDVEEQTLDPMIRITPSSVISFNLSRSDAEVKNYFFTYPIQNLIGGTTAFKATVMSSASTVDALTTNPIMIPHDDEDAGLNRFGFRKFENTSEYFDKGDLGTSKELAIKLNKILHKAMKNNGNYESGSFTVKGDSDIRPGKYITFDTRAGVKPEFYIAGVSHQLNLEHGSESFQTSVSVERGDGYLKTWTEINNSNGEFII